MKDTSAWEHSCIIDDLKTLNFFCRYSNLHHILQLHHLLIILASFLCTLHWLPIFRMHFEMILRLATLPTSYHRQLFFYQSALSHYGFRILHSTLSFLLDTSPQISSPLPNSIRMSAPKKTSLLPPLLFRLLSFTLSHQLRTHFPAVDFFCWRRRRRCIQTSIHHLLPSSFSINPLRPNIVFTPSTAFPTVQIPWGFHSTLVIIKENMEIAVGDKERHCRAIFFCVGHTLSARRSLSLALLGATHRPPLHTHTAPNQQTPHTAASAAVSSHHLFLFQKFQPTRSRSSSFHCWWLNPEKRTRYYSTQYPPQRTPFPVSPFGPPAYTTRNATLPQNGRGWKGATPLCTIRRIRSSLPQTKARSSAIPSERVVPRRTSDG